MQDKSDISALPFLAAVAHQAGESKLALISNDKPDKGLDKKHNDSDH